MAKFFGQNWHFFAPVPGYFTDKLWIGCTFKNGDKTVWIDPVARAIKSAEKWPFSYYGKETYMHRQIATNVLDELNTKARIHCKVSSEQKNIEICQVAVNEVTRSPVYQRAIRYAKESCQVLRSSLNGDLKEVQIMATKKVPFPYSERHLRAERPFYQLQNVSFAGVPVP